MTERAFLLQTENENAIAAQLVRGGIKHLDYLNKHWMTIPIWQSWSDFGQIHAFSVLKIPVEGVIPMTNHLELFNAILK